MKRRWKKEEKKTGSQVVVTEEPFALGSLHERSVKARRTTRWARFYSNSRVNSGLRPRVCRWSPRSFSKGLAGVTILTRAVKNVGINGRRRRRTPTIHRFLARRKAAFVEARSRARLASRSFPVPYRDIFMTDILAAADLGHPLSRVPPTWRTLESRGRIANLVTARVANRSRQDIIFPTLTHYVYIHSWILRHVDGREPTINHFESVVAPGSIWPRQSS